MNIVVATPLFPPDTGAPAPYVKELVARLKDGTVSLVLYGRFPEVVKGVSFHSVSKRSRLFVRLFQYTKTLYKVAKKSDVIYAQNGVSVELPAAIVSFLTKTPLVFCISDPIAYANQHKNIIHKIIHALTERQSKKTIMMLEDASYIALSRPEILPFSEYPTEAFATYEEAWTKHIAELTNIFKHVCS